MSKNRNKGFTLLEVLVAVVIFAGAATVLVASYVNILGNFEESRIKTNYEEELAYVRSEFMILSDVEEVLNGGEFDMGNGVVGTWNVELEMTEIPNLFWVNLIVDMRNDAGKPIQLNQILYLLRPSWAEPDEVDKARQDLQERMQDFREDQQFGWDFGGL